MDCDVLMVNNYGPAFTGESVRREGVGGSELEIVQIAEVLASRGHRVIVANGVGSAVESHGVKYIPFALSAGLRAHALYIERGTVPPDNIHANRIVVRATDIMCDFYEPHRKLLASSSALLVGVSQWQLDGFRRAIPGVRTECIHPILDATRPTERVPGRFIFASAPCKGLTATLTKWREMVQKYPKEMAKAHLVVVLPGYATGEAPTLDAYDRQCRIEFLGAPTLEDYRSLIASAQGLFFVNTMAETFGNVAALAERSGTRVHILLRDGWGGLQEALTGWPHIARVRHLEPLALVTADDRAFEEDFVRALPRAAHESASMTTGDHSAGALAPAWEKALDLLTPAPVVSDAALLDELRRGLAEKPVLDATVSEYWQGRCIAIAADAVTKRMEDFLSWSNDVSHEELPVFAPWYAALKADAEWPRWERLTRKSPHGNPHPFSLDAGTTPVTVQHAYHLLRYERATGTRFLDDLDMIVEVGGGYGNFCRMLRADGFTGEHVIIDLPHVQAIQRAYLGLCGVEANLALESGIPNILKMVSGKRVAFVATFSLSETPIAFRAKLFPALHEHCTKYLIATQWPSHCMEPDVSNADYFDGFMRDAGGVWHTEEIAGFGGHRYLFGSPKLELARKPGAPSAESQMVQEPPLNTDHMGPFFGDFLSLLRSNVAVGGSELGLAMSLFSLAVSTRAACVVEIGRFKGFSTLALAGAMRFNAHGWREPKAAEQRPDVDYAKLHAPKRHKVVSIDSHPEAAAVELLAKAGLTEFVQLVDQPSEAVTLKGHPIDLLFIDGDHTYVGCKQDVAKFVPLVRAGGYVVLHDYFGWYKDGQNGSPIKRVADDLIRLGIEHLLVDTGYASLVVFRKGATTEGKAPVPVPPREDGKPTVGLVVLAKNENPIVARALMSCAEWVDARTVLVDAESNDGTAELCERLGAEVHVRPYAGSLAETRNEALALAEQRTDYMLIVDADDRIDGPRPDVIAHDVYDLTIHDGGLTYVRGQLVKSRIGARYLGCDRGCKMNIPHEYLVVPGANHGGLLPALAYHRLGAVRGVSGWQDQAGARAKYLRHAKDLQRHHAEHPEDARTVHYLGQSFRDAGEPAQARDWYRKRVAMAWGPGDEEAWFAQIRVAELTQHLGEDPVAEWWHAHEMRPTRADALVALAIWYRDDKRKRFEMAYTCAKLAAAIPQPMEDKMFLIPAMYQWGARAELAIAAHWTGRLEEAEGLWRQLLTLVPEDQRPWAHGCMEMTQRALAEVRARQPR